MRRSVRGHSAATEDLFADFHHGLLGLIVFSSCSHAGIVNVCTEVRRLFPDTPIYCVMGGLHLGGVMEKIIPDISDAEEKVAPVATV